MNLPESQTSRTWSSEGERQTGNCKAVMRAVGEEAPHTQTLWLTHADSQEALVGLHNGPPLFFSNRSRRPRWPRWKSMRPGSTIDRWPHALLCSTSSWTTSAGSTPCTSFLSRWLAPGVFHIIVTKQHNMASAIPHDSLPCAFISCGRSLRPSPGEQLQQCLHTCTASLVSLAGAFTAHRLFGWSWSRTTPSPGLAHSVSAHDVAATNSQNVWERIPRHVRSDLCPQRA